MKMTSSRWTVSVDNCSAVHADIYRRYPANKEAKPFSFLRVCHFQHRLYAEYESANCCTARLSESDKHVQNPVLRHYTIPLCQTLRSIKSRSTLRSCWVIRFTLDRRPKTSLQQVQKLQASSTTLFTCSFFLLVLFPPILFSYSIQR